MNNQTEEIVSKGPVLLMMALCTFVCCLSMTQPQLINRELLIDLGNEHADWIFGAAMVGMAVGMAAYAFFEPVIGKRKTFLIGVVLYLIGIFGCALVDSMESFVALRVFLGLGAGFTVSAGLTFLGEAYEKVIRYRPHCLLVASFGLGMLYGCLFGYSTRADWQLYLGILGVVYLVFAVIALAKMRDGVPGIARPRYVLTTLVVLTVALVAYMVERWSTDLDLWDAQSIALIVIAIILGCCCIYAAFKDGSGYGKAGRTDITMSFFGLAFLGMFLISGMMYLVQTGVRIYALNITDLGIDFLALVLGAAICAISGFKAVGKIGSAGWAVIGFAFAAIAMLWGSCIDAGDGEGLFAAHLFVFGLGLGSLAPMLNDAVQYASHKEDIGMTSSTGIAIRTVGITAGIYICSSFVANSGDFLDGLSDGFVANGVILALAAVVAAVFVSYRHAGA